MNQDVVKELNAFLKGQYMGIHAYEHLIQRAGDPEVKGLLQQIQQDHKQHALKVAERIQDLGGTPVDDEGFVGSIQGIISRVTAPNETHGILQSALKGEGYYGVEVSEEIVKGDLDPESKRIVESILDEDRQHVDVLQNVLR